MKSAKKLRIRSALELDVTPEVLQDIAQIVNEHGGCIRPIDPDPIGGGKRQYAALIGPIIRQRKFLESVMKNQRTMPEYVIKEIEGIRGGIDKAHLHVRDSVLVFTEEAFDNVMIDAMRELPVFAGAGIAGQ